MPFHVRDTNSTLLSGKLMRLYATKNIGKRSWYFIAGYNMRISIRCGLHASNNTNFCVICKRHAAPFFEIKWEHHLLNKYVTENINIHVFTEALQQIS